MKKIFVIMLVLLLATMTMCQASEFEDVSEDSWYYKTVNEMAEKGYISGYTDGTFRPDDTISRSEFVSIVARCMSVGEKLGQTSHWSAGVMQATLDRGWYDWDEIPPTGEKFDTPIERKLAVKIIINALDNGAKGEYTKWSSVINDFSELDGRYYDVVFAAYETGIVYGDNNGNFNPNKGLTRAEACAIIARSISIDAELPAIPIQTTEPIVELVSGGVSENGFLQVVGTQLCNSEGNPIILRGMSTHGMQWFGQFASHGAIKTTRDYGANVFRIAMYTDEGGYISNPSVKDSVIRAIDDAISLDMYVIVDWHILSDGNPQKYTDNSKEFFKEIATKYNQTPNVIYEICNEPNGNVTWENNIKPYAEEVIPVIREISPSSVILVGTGTWSQDVDHVSKSPLSYDNVMYTCHFYSGTHGRDLQNKIDTALNANTPIFVSEWGASQASGSGGAYTDQARQWLDFLKERGISWVNWSLCDKSESSAALSPGANPNGGWSEDDLTESGKFVFSEFN